MLGSSSNGRLGFPDFPGDGWKGIFDGFRGALDVRARFRSVNAGTLGGNYSGIRLSVFSRFPALCFERSRIRVAEESTFS